MAPTTDNVLGFLALAAYIATLLPSNLKVVFPAVKSTAFNKVLLKHRRSIGLWVFGLSVAHACVVIVHHNVDLSQMSFYRQSISGLIIFGIFALLTVTSNNWSIKKLKRNWKRLHSLTYLAAILLPWHIAAKMAGKWNLATVLGFVLISSLILLCGFKKYKSGLALGISRPNKQPKRYQKA